MLLVAQAKIQELIAHVLNKISENKMGANNSVSPADRDAQKSLPETAVVTDLEQPQPNVVLGTPAVAAIEATEIDQDSTPSPLPTLESSQSDPSTQSDSGTHQVSSNEGKTFIP